jgi:MoaA/NifB/PqqE/SkfB family radical SAM enzyme
VYAEVLGNKYWECFLTNTGGLYMNNSLHIEAVEVTNICNLKCANCGVPTAKYHRGFIEDETVREALKWTKKGQLLCFHLLGEPLLHSNLETYIRWACAAEVKPAISTNGLLLTRERWQSLYASGLRHICFSLHVMKSLEVFLDICSFFREQGIEAVNYKMRNRPLNKDVVYMCGKILVFPKNRDQNANVRKALKEIPEYVKPLLQITNSHTWAGNILGMRQTFSDELTAKRQKCCYFIKNKIVNVRWDGPVVGCCFDHENENELTFIGDCCRGGGIMNFEKLIIDIDKYALCKHCHGSWATNEQPEWLQ